MASLKSRHGNRIIRQLWRIVTALSRRYRDIVISVSRGSHSSNIFNAWSRRDIVTALSRRCSVTIYLVFTTVSLYVVTWRSTSLKCDAVLKNFFESTSEASHQSRNNSANQILSSPYKSSIIAHFILQFPSFLFLPFLHSVQLPLLSRSC